MHEPASRTSTAVRPFGRSVVIASELTLGAIVGFAITRFVGLLPFTR
jgi:hypothetical protein